MNALVDDSVEPIRMWLQRAMLTSVDSEESPSTSRLEVTNTCTLANEWTEEDSMAEQVIHRAMEEY